MAIDINILSSLNEEQRNAVMDIYGPVMIIAECDCQEDH